MITRLLLIWMIWQPNELLICFDWDNKSEDEMLLKESYVSLIHEIVNTLEAYLDREDVEVSVNDKRRILRIVKKLRQMVSMWCVC